jgi:hypothetical protein
MATPGADREVCLIITSIPRNSRSFIKDVIHKHSQVTAFPTNKIAWDEILFYLPKDKTGKLWKYFLGSS